ncbi:MAG TPA: hypothetical protein DD618_01105 [Acholeplasmatales bacterium]|nr:hypothetical protein [Acholeplasmatales bacterium]
MKKKIVYVPLDERPCNLDFPQEIFKFSDLDMVVPGPEILGVKKTPANHEALETFLIKETKGADGLVISVDMLIYGGIVPSRLHHLNQEELVKRLAFLEKIRFGNPNLVIYGFQLIMRCPQGNSSDEEPDYYKECGREIFLSGHYKNKKELGIITPDEEKQYSKLKIKKEFLSDFLTRRQINVSMNIMTLELLEKGVFDFLVIPQDDASEYGYTAIDQERVRDVIRAKRLMLKAYMYPGADEVGCILVTRMLNHFHGRKPAVYVRYPSPSTPFVIPCLEDRYVDVTIKYQIAAAGGITVPSLADADLVLLVFLGATKMLFHPNNVPSRDVDVLCNFSESVVFAQHAIAQGCPVGVADLVYLNGGSLDLINHLESAGLTMKVAAYSGWNTSSNSLGTTISQAMNYLYSGNTESHQAFLAKRYLEDAGYCGSVRAKVAERLKEYGMDYFNVKEKTGIASRMVFEELEKFAAEHLPSIYDSFEIDDVNLPWKRMFEVGFTVRKKDRK